MILRKPRSTQSSSSAASDVNKRQGMKCGLTYERDMSVRSYEENEFTREIQFNSEIETIEIL